MNYKISFQERAKLGMEQISKQLPVTLKEAKEQALWLSKQSTLKKTKYNSEIDAAVKRVRNGKSISNDKVIDEMNKW